MMCFPGRFVRRLLWLVGWAMAFLVLGCGKSKQAGEEPPAPPAPVKVVHAHEEEMAEWTDLPGTTLPLPNHMARVSAAIDGKVLSVLPDGSNSPAAAEGAEVQPDQIIVQLNDLAARATLAKTMAVQHELEAQKQQADTAVRLATVNLQSLKQLKGGPTSTLVSEVDVQRLNLALEDAQGKQQEAAAKLASNQVEIKAINDQLKLYTLRSPIRGRLGAIQVVPGQSLIMGATVADVVDLKDIDVLCFVPPSTLSRLTKGPPHKLARLVRTDRGVPEESAPQGNVVFIADQAQADTGSFPVKVRFPNEKLELRANLVVRVSIQTQPEEKRLVLPDAALMEDQEPPEVVVVQTELNEKKEEKQIAHIYQAVVGIHDREKHLVEIRGLKASDPEGKPPTNLREVQFVVEGGHGLHEGDEVKPEEPKKEGAED
ncbi:MAG: efflux RND transporter periplasmic adaptor subunit [Planctomycetes bacterium]|nr:efflux RND transporter periplasmic adaptor subunit [Planctomycetota bacterium]